MYLPIPARRKRHWSGRLGDVDLVGNARDVREKLGPAGDNERAEPSHKVCDVRKTISEIPDRGIILVECIKQKDCFTACLGANLQQQLIHAKTIEWRNDEPEAFPSRQGARVVIVILVEECRFTHSSICEDKREPSEDRRTEQPIYL
jgi:hypothetical protein